MGRAEILAPAGAMEQVRAAVRCGADAVYLGARGFNARRNAENFGDGALAEAVAYCHARNARVYVTVNTLVMDSERRALEETAEEVAASGADAVIIQDLAVLELFRERYPTLERYSSTQTAVHNVDGALFLQEQGFQSVLIARELTLEEMARICESVDIKTEVFVHGAHCMSVSGMCYLSAVLGGRSGNRGLCAQPCRLDWRCGGRDYALSLKDMSLIAHLRDLEAAGIDSFKIEGRMKRPEYVAAAVAACRASLDGRPYDEESLRAVFSRSGFTDGYLTGRRDAAMFGSRTREDVVGADKVLGPLRSLYKNEMPRVQVDITFEAEEGGSRLTVSDGERSVSAAGEAPQQALSRPLDAESARRSLEKTGGTPFVLREFSARIAPGLMLSAAALNAMRRAALDALLAERSEPRPHRRREGELPGLPAHAAPERPALWARFARADQIPTGERYERILLPAEAIGPAERERYGDALAAELPAVLFPADEEAFAARLKALRELGVREVYAENCYGAVLGRRLGLTVRGGAGLNILNSRALAAYERLGLASATVSFELSFAKCRALAGTLPRGIVAYGRLPLMRWRNCPVRASLGCGRCGGAGELTDRLGVRFPVECGPGRRYSTLLNSVPLHIADRDLRGVDYLLLYFTRENAAECARVTEDYRLGRRAEGARTGGLYYRELL